MKVKKIIICASFIILVLFLFHYLFSNNVFANTSCETVTDNIKYFNATLYNYDARNFNAWARNYTLNDFNQLSIEQRINVDKQCFLFGDAGIKSDWNWKNLGSTDLMYGGIQNGIISVEQINVMVHNTSNEGVHRGFVSDKLVNDNIVLTYKNKNNIELFPNITQAEGRGLVGVNQVYKEILRDYKIPFIQEPSGYYFFDSNEYHLRRNQNNSFDLHIGKSGGISEWSELEKGFFPFNRDCFIGETAELNELYYGMRLDIPFYMNNSGKMLNYETEQLEDIIFDFRGDDDVWIFVDDSLVLDLGGGHMAMSGYVNFSKNESYIDSVVNADNTLTKDVYTKNIFGEHTLAEGEHTLKIFYLERFRGNSKF